MVFARAVPQMLVLGESFADEICHSHGLEQLHHSNPGFARRSSQTHQKMGFPWNRQIVSVDEEVAEAAEVDVHVVAGDRNGG